MSIQASPTPPKSPIFDLFEENYHSQCCPNRTIATETYKRLTHYQRIASQITAIIKEVENILGNPEKVKNKLDIESKIIEKQNCWKSARVLWSGNIEALNFLISHPSHFDLGTNSLNLEAINGNLSKLNDKVDNYKLISGLYTDIYNEDNFQDHAIERINEWIQQMNLRQELDRPQKKVFKELNLITQKKTLKEFKFFYITPQNKE